MGRNPKKSVSIKKGDTVKVIAGTDKGAEGKVISVLREERRVIVEGVNRVKRHTKVVNHRGPDPHLERDAGRGQGRDPRGLQARRGAQAPPGRVDVRRPPQRAHLPQDREGDLT
jgi:hypothetical protein